MSDNPTSTGAEDPSIDNLWGDAMSEQQAASSASQNTDDLSLIMDIPVKMTVELGRTKMTIKELLRLSQGSVVTLDGLAGEPLDILINGYLIAQGEVVVVSDKFGIRITEIITPSERMHRLSR
ncbi:flagellar motor switch protein FliN [Erwinia sp. S63]|uniref:flagellar motor switch protein FliN n=1 Tax=Enterobacterales TaxID=91347 RepID=UPI0005375E40|nr:MULTISPECIES: flagellar motor switch protein FliN [Enterobacterales]KGT89709.1 flagellar motor switch protein FliN [Enterobacter cancerogenus]MBK0097991.1 flagellar motor switch protein FliN [Erwinia sp. S63]